MLPFLKAQAVGNDFPVVLVSDVAANAPAGSSVDFQLARLAAVLSDRRFGVGGDGLLAIDRGDGKEPVLRMFNPDGTEDFCGNGIRIAAVVMRRLGWVGDAFTMRHLNRQVPVRFREDGAVETTLGAADYSPDHVPTTAMGELFQANIWAGMDAGMPLSLYGSALTTGSTHTVIPTYALPDDDSFRSVSAKIEVDPLFPQRTSVIWVRDAAENVLEIRIWERGVGETLGCGTGSGAAAADYLRRKGRGGTVTVHNPGGTLEVRADRWNAPLTIVGRAEVLYEGKIAV